MILGIPGTWENRTAIVRAIAKSDPPGRFLFLGGLLADLAEKEHVGVDVDEAPSRQEQAFHIAAQGKISQATLRAIGVSKCVAYAHFEMDALDERARLRKFTRVLHEAGGIAIKVESSGVAHEFARWFELLDTDNPFDLYCAIVNLIAGDDHYYSCGMHCFGLEDSGIGRHTGVDMAADVLNRFNYWRLVERPVLKCQETFSVTPTSERFRLFHVEDQRHKRGDPFHNPKGLWMMEPT